MHTSILGQLLVPLLAFFQDGGDSKSLQQRMEEMEKRHADEIEKLQDQIDALSEKQSTPPPTSSPAQSLNAFNPQMTVFANFLARSDSKAVTNDSGDRIDDRFSLREAEIDFRAAVDPWADAVVIASFEADTPGDFNAGIEEGYFTLKKLPLLDSDPLGIRFEIGRFRPAFGRINKIHTHDLPWMDRPGSFAEYLGTEGFSSDGISGQVFLPTPGKDSTLELTAQAVNGGENPLTAANRSNDPAYVQHLSWFCDVAPGHDVELGESSYFGRADADGRQETQLLGLDATYHWKPFSAGEFNSFLIGGELFACSQEQAVGTRERPLGWYAWTQWQASQNLYLGLRWDEHELLADDRMKTRQLGAYATYYTTEFLRFRLGVERSTSDDPKVDGLVSALLEFNVVFGSHPVEPYWVNK